MTQFRPEAPPYFTAAIGYLMGRENGDLSESLVWFARLRSTVCLQHISIDRSTIVTFQIRRAGYRRGIGWLSGNKTGTTRRSLTEEEHQRRCVADSRLIAEDQTKPKGRDEPRFFPAHSMPYHHSKR